jgi:hypothetical protein
MTGTERHISADELPIARLDELIEFVNSGAIENIRDETDLDTALRELKQFREAGES